MANRNTKVVVDAVTANYVAEVDKAAKATRGLNTEAAKIAEHDKALQSLGRGAMVAGVAVTAATALVTKAAIDWESAWAGVTKTVDGTPEQMAELEEGLRGLAKTLPATHQELAAVAEAAGQLGVAREDIIDFTETMVALGETTNLTADEAATSIAQLMNVMQSAPDDVDNLGSALVALGNDGASTERDIIQMAQRIAGAGKTVGLTEAQVLGFANALASVGIEAEAGGSAISRIMTDMAMDVAKGGDGLQRWAEVAGVSAASFAESFETDPADAIATFIEGLGRVEEAGGNVFQTLSDLGQTDIRVSQALLGMANSGDLLRESLELGAEAWDENTALMAEAEKRYDTTEAKLQTVANRVNDAAIAFGQVFLPAVEGAAEAVGSFADFMGGLPPEMQSLVATVTALGGGVALLGGAALVAVPKVVALKSSLATLGVTAKTTKAALADAGKAAGVVAAIALAHELRMWAAGFTGATKSAAELKKEITGPNGLKSAMDVFDSGEMRLFGQDASRDNIKALTGDFKDLSNFAADFQNSWAGTAAEIASFGLVDTSLGRAASNAKELDTALAQLVSEGNAELAAEAVAAKAKESKVSVAELVELLPQYASAQGEAGKVTDEAAAATVRYAEAAEEATAANEAWLEQVAGSDAAFVSITDAYSAVIQKNQEFAQSTADSTEDAEDSWTDYYDGVSVGFADYLAELEAQVAAQEAWEDNMILLAGRVSQETLDELARLGPEAAPLVADMVNASDAELDKMDELFAQRSAEATGAFATTLADAQIVIAAAAGQLGQEAANEIAAKLAAGTHTVAQIMEEYGLEIAGIRPQVQIGTEEAQANLDAFFAANNGRTLFLNSHVATGPGGSGGQVFGSANGNMFAYADGGFGAGFYKGGAPLYKFAEPEVRWEAFISGKPGQEERNRGIALNAYELLGGRLPSDGADMSAVERLLMRLEQTTREVRDRTGMPVPVGAVQGAMGSNNVSNSVRGA